MNISLSPVAELDFDIKPSSKLRLSVIVPAKDEETMIGITLEALRSQVDDQGRAIDPAIYEVLVLANNCSDDTYQKCLSYQQQYPEFRLAVEYRDIAAEIAHIGTVRRMLMDAAYSRLVSTAGERGIIISTDADSEVDPTWIYHILQEMEKGVDVVGGRILPKNTPKLSKIHHLRDVKYRFLRTRLESELDPCFTNPWPRHFQCFGPSMAMTCGIYVLAGRLPAIPYLEDEEFRKALIRVDAKFRHSTKVRISTSARFDGRVAFGFSVQLQKWSQMSINQQEQMVESLYSFATKLKIKSELRKAWKLKTFADHLDLTFSIHQLGLRRHALMQMICENTYFESFWEQIEKHISFYCPGMNGTVPISKAIEEFRCYFSGIHSLKSHDLNQRAVPLIAV